MSFTVGMYLKWVCLRMGGFLRVCLQSGCVSRTRQYVDVSVGEGVHQGKGHQVVGLGGDGLGGRREEGGQVEHEGDPTYNGTASLYHTLVSSHPPTSPHSHSTLTPHSSPLPLTPPTPSPHPHPSLLTPTPHTHPHSPDTPQSGPP